MKPLTALITVSAVAFVVLAHPVPTAEEVIPELEPVTVETEMVMEATAYTHAAPGGDINGTGDGITAIGWRVDRGIAAVDPAVIPLGSIIHIEGYGYAVTADRGGAIKGNRIDVFMDSREKALEWGRKRVRVEIVHKSE